MTRRKAAANWSILALVAFASQPAYAERWVQVDPKDPHLWYDADSVGPSRLQNNYVNLVLLPFGPVTALATWDEPPGQSTVLLDEFFGGKSSFSAKLEAEEGV